MDENIGIYLKPPDLPGTDSCTQDNEHFFASHRCSLTTKEILKIYLLIINIKKGTNWF